MGFKQPDNIYFREGKICHRIIQDHVARIKTHKSLKHILYQFPIVEIEDFDPRCKFEFEVDSYTIIGYYDGLNWKNKRFLEIKSSSTLWTMGKFQKAIQRKIYALANPKKLDEACLITGSRKPADWKTQPPKFYKVPLTQQDRDEALTWIKEGIKIIKAGEFTSDLVDGKCVDPRCYWGENCQFK